MIHPLCKSCVHQGDYFSWCAGNCNDCDNPRITPEGYQPMDGGATDE